jgi:hypothetical protein
MARLQADCLEGGCFDNASSMHHYHPVGESGKQRRVMSNENNRELKTAFPFFQEAQNFCLYHVVQRAGWLVGNKQAGFCDQRLRNDDPLALATAQLMRICGEEASVEKTCCREHRPGFVAQRFTSIAGMGPQYFGDLFTNWDYRVQRELRFLGNQGYLGATNLPEPSLTNPDQILSSKSNRSRRYAKSGAKKSNQTAGKSRLTSTRFSKDAQRFTWKEVKTDMIQGQPAGLTHLN